MLYSNGLINMRKGYGHEIKSKARQTKIWPSTKMLKIFKSVRTEDCIFDPVELVNLRDESGKSIDYRDTKETRRVREILRKANIVNDRSLVQYVDPKSHAAYRLETRLYCVYNGDFNHGGRFYTREKDGYQQLSEEERKCIYIDGEPTIELDFSGLHPRLLYAWEDIQYNDDPYSAVIDDRELRPVIKNLFMAVLNSDNEITAVRAENKHLFDNRKYYDLVHQRGLRIKDHLLPMFKRAHRPIAKYFCTGTGLKAMNMDAKIALGVLAHFANDGIPILAIHVSFIVQRRYKHRLRDVMKFSYKKQTGGFRCPIK